MILDTSANTICFLNNQDFSRRSTTTETLSPTIVDTAADDSFIIVSGSSINNYNFPTNHHTRIQTPLPQDVLCGRGGPINLHPRNKIFREWVRLWREGYNRACTKTERLVVAMGVI